MSKVPARPSADALSLLAGPAAEARRWLFEVAAPVWAEAGRLEGGALAERLLLDGRVDIVPRRIFVQARHLYAYATLGRLGWQGPWRRAAEGVFDHLLAKAIRHDGLVIHRLNPQGARLDMRADLYDQAFFLLAMAEAERTLRREDALLAAHKVMDALERRWRHPAGGFLEGEITLLPRRQNPHMHLLEGLLALTEVDPRGRWRELAREIVTLCLERFIEPASGALLEYFTMDLAPLAADQGQRVEPGHCLEWAWLLERATDLHPGARDASGRLTAFARAHGLDPARGVAIDAVTLNGEPQDLAARLWPQTERMKAALARLRRLGDPAEVEEALAAFRGLQPYLAMPVPGTWRDRMLADGSWVEEPARGSSLYHITCAYAELIDLAGI